MVEIATPMLLRGAVKGTGYGKKKLQKRIRNSAISEVLRATETEFHRTFQTELQRVAKAQNSTELEAISLIWDNIAEDISQEHLATSDTETAIEKLVEAIENTADIELQETDKAELKEIINKSYQSSVEKFRSKLAGTELADELHAEFGQSILNSINELQKELEHIRDQVTPYKPYDIFSIPDDKQEFLQSLNTDTRLTYIDHNDVATRDLGKTLIVGAAGSGKTRAMYQMLILTDIST